MRSQKYGLDVQNRQNFPKVMKYAGRLESANVPRHDRQIVPSQAIDFLRPPLFRQFESQGGRVAAHACLSRRALSIAC